MKHAGDTREALGQALRPLALCATALARTVMRITSTENNYYTYMLQRILHRHYIDITSMFTHICYSDVLHISIHIYLYARMESRLRE